MAEESGGPLIKSDLVWFLLILMFLFIAWIAQGGPARMTTGNKTSTSSPLITLPHLPSVSTSISRSTSVSATKPSNSNESVYKGKIKVGLGNAASERQPDREYINLYYSGGSNDLPIDITGWTLKNGYNEKLEGRINPDDEAFGALITLKIPKGVSVFRPETQSQQEDILLKPGDRAYVVTGLPNTKFPYFLKTSFRVNKCSSYLAHWETFYPSLSSNCPSYRDLPGLGLLSDECYKFITRMNQCATPAYDYIYQFKEVLSNQCRQFYEINYGYDKCLARYENDKDFQSKEWRIFLGHRVEIWGQQRDSISLYDRAGKLVDRYTY